MRYAALARAAEEIDEMTVRSVPVTVAGTVLVCDMLGIAYLEASRTLIVSDLHLETGSAFARRGMLLPPYDTAATLDLLQTVLRHYRPESVISLGDSFHDRRGAEHLPATYRMRLKELMRGVFWYWVSGNHDPEPPADLPGDSVDAIATDGLTFRHEPLAGRVESRGEVAGHLHPCARVIRRGRAVRRPCFAADGNRLVMPAFGVTTGGLDLRHRAMEGLFDRTRLAAHMLGQRRIYSVRFANLSG